MDRKSAKQQNYLTLSCTGGFWTNFQIFLRGGKTKFLDFCFIWAFEIKRFARSRIFRYGLPQDVLCKGKKKGGERGVQVALMDINAVLMQWSVICHQYTKPISASPTGNNILQIILKTIS